ncbi:MATE family efflux transporter [Eubacterium sp. OM08-24]|uniref:MATE family efflux transporter n=1 Tax=Eubacterium sp. OM08-24 TaxID=2292352 RepID=UPI000E43066A|nr:MATE family efflux transporter [Eubacterium sp. OM08-24]RGM17406.1 MATE family efflux transporter [Eubacterium sp. OM08-24]
MIQLSEHFSYIKLMRFTIPTIAMMIFTSIYGVVDGLFVSNIVGSESFAGVNLIMPALMMLGSVGFMVGTGGSALVSKTIGEGNKKLANRYFSMLIYFLLIVGIVLSILGNVFIRQISELLGAKGEMVDICSTYGRTLLCSLPFFMLQNCFQSFLVVAEKPAMGLCVSVIAGLSNMVLDFLFIYVFRLGVFGAALATAISEFVGAAIPLIFFIRKNNSPLKLIKTKLELKPILRTCSNGSSEMVTNISMSLVNMLYNLQLVKFAGYDGVVAYGIIMYVGFIFSGTYLGYCVGVAPIVGYHYGAANTAELKNLFKKSLFLLSSAAVVLTACAELLSSVLAGIFVGYNQDLHDMTTNAIQLFALSYIISGINIFASAFFTALNNGLVSAVISFMRTLVFQIAFIFILPELLGLNGIWLAVVGAEICSLIISVSFFVANRKKYKYV